MFKRWLQRRSYEKEWDRNMKKMIVLSIVMLLVCGCTNQKCVKSHEEEETCVWYSYIRIGNTSSMIPHYYSCTKTICDEYEVIKNDE